MGETQADKYRKTTRHLSDIARLATTSLPCFPTPQCREHCFHTTFGASLRKPAKLVCSSVHVDPHPLRKTWQCLNFISLRSGHLLNTSLTWDSDLLLPDVYQVSIWTSSLGTDRSSSHIFVAPFMRAVSSTRSITVTSLLFDSRAQFTYWRPELCQILGFG